MILNTLLALALACSPAAEEKQNIRINQVAMYPSQEKVAVVEGGKEGQKFTITDARGKRVMKGKATRVATSPWSGKQRAIMDFTKLRKPGVYTLVTEGQQRQFTISDQALDAIADAVLKSYYLIRSGMPIEAEYAGEYARPTGHPDTQVLIHPSAASKFRRAGSVISSPGGWYDAGDYNKYIVNSAFTVAQMLGVYQQNQEYCAQQNTHIPESNNHTPDYLDEMMYNLRWMLSMQDPSDGGVYHKLTTPSFEGFVMPTDCHQQRYVVKKTVTAALDFAAVMAMASRIYEGNTDYPQFAQMAREGAQEAWNWAIAHPDALYDQNAMNQQFDPDVTTGAYDDRNASDEFFWAATELYLLTGEKKYLDAAHQHQPRGFISPAWGNPTGLALFAWATSQADDALVATSRQWIIDYARDRMTRVATSNFQCPSGDRKEDFGWASIAESFATVGITMLYAHQLTGDPIFLTGAHQCADYMLGRNALDLCFVTGFGQRSPMHPHHRPSHADGIEAPYPGLLVGGPNPAQQDLATVPGGYPSKHPDESYIDDMNSYASNEIAINWNSAAVGLLTWLARLK